MDFIVKNRSEISNAYYPGGSAIIITITDPDKDWVVPSGKYKEVLCIKFDDADVQVTQKIKLIDGDTAREILNFVQDNIDVDYCVVNCEAGLSRSAGCAAALSKIFTGDDFPVILAKPMFNRKVYREIMNVYEESLK